MHKISHFTFALIIKTKTPENKYLIAILISAYGGTCMGHRSISICTWIKENSIQNTFTVLEI